MTSIARNGIRTPSRNCLKGECGSASASGLKGEKSSASSACTRGRTRRAAFPKRQGMSFASSSMSLQRLYSAGSWHATPILS